MKLDRNINGTGRGKYGLIKTRVLAEIQSASIHPADSAHATIADRKCGHVMKAIKTLEDAGVIEWGEPGAEGEFFVIKLRDEYAQGALARYAMNAMGAGDGDLAVDVFALAERSGIYNPFCKKPD
jgi:hypothetical protein